MHYYHNNTTIYIYAMPVLDSRMYIVKNDENPKEALIIDPIIDEDVLTVLDTIEQATVLLTHSHYDHISGVNWLREQINCTVFCSEICAKRITDCHENLSAFSPALVIGKTEEEQALCMEFMELDYTCHADKTFDRETSFAFGSYAINIRYTPGHSPCSQCIEMTDTKTKNIFVFTGDSMVNGANIITRLPGGSKKEYLAVTKPYLDSLSDDTMIMPGHGDCDFKKNIAKEQR